MNAIHPEFAEALCVGGPFDGTVLVTTLTLDGEPTGHTCRIYNRDDPYGYVTLEKPVFVAIYEWDGCPRTWQGKSGDYFHLKLKEIMSKEEYAQRHPPPA